MISQTMAPLPSCADVLDTAENLLMYRGAPRWFQKHSTYGVGDIEF
jgi:hypothetical protein